MSYTRPHVWTDEQKDYMKKIVPGRYRKEIHKMVNEEFNLNLTFNQVIGFMKRNNLKTGFDGRFIKGQEVWNKGMKGLVIEGSQKGWFKKGVRSSNYRPVGSERVDSKDGYIIIKVQDEGKFQERWKHKHIVVWEKHHGKVPEDHVVVFLDTDRTNTDITNLELLSRAELSRMNRENLFSDDPEITKAGINLVRLKQNVFDIEIKGKDKNKYDEYVRKAKMNGIDEQTLIARRKRGWSMKDAIYKPLHFRFKNNNLGANL